jgi:hypothetical protein
VLLETMTSQPDHRRAPSGARASLLALVMAACLALALSAGARADSPYPALVAPDCF